MTSVIEYMFEAKTRAQGRVCLSGRRSEFVVDACSGVIRCRDGNGFDLRINLAKVEQQMEDRPQFFIPSSLINCRLSDGRKVQCEGYADLILEEIRIDAVDHDWFWFSIV